MKINDKRAPEQQSTHTMMVVGTDSFMSGWGRGEGGASYAAWACRLEDLDAVERWVRLRGEMRRVRVVGADYRPDPNRCAHLTIYPVGNGHAALR